MLSPKLFALLIKVVMICKVIVVIGDILIKQFGETSMPLMGNAKVSETENAANNAG